MKVYITDTRRDTRIIVIDGRHIILPSKKEVLRDISTSAFRSLSTLPFIKLRVYEEPKQLEHPETQTESAPVEEPNQEEPVVEKNDITEQEPSTSVIVEQEETSTEEPEQESTVEETPVEENQNQQSEPVDYSKLTKKELKEMAEARGCDTTGMVKADLVQWLTENA